MIRSTALNIVSAKCLPVRLDFRMDVIHSLASRYHTVNVCVVLESDSGFVGYGECVPRSYVTGETPESVLQVLSEILQSITGENLSSPEKVLSLLVDVGTSETGTRNPSAICALELSLLDLAGKHWNVSVSDLLGLTRKATPLFYSLVVPLLPVGDLHKFLEPTKIYRFAHVKVKVDTQNPAERVRTVKDILGSGVEIRVDANCSWNSADAPGFFRELADLGVVSVEQPLPADDLYGMAELRKSGTVPITLDESVLNPSDVECAASAGAGDIINARISKCGGLLGVLRVIEAAHSSGLDVQLGAQVGESCILSAAGVCLAAGTFSFRWLEGFFGTHLLVKDLCSADIRFGHGGRVVPPVGPGLGVPVDRDYIDEAHALCEKSKYAENHTDSPD